MVTRPDAPPSSQFAGQAAEVLSRTRERHLQRVEVLEQAVLALMEGDLCEEMRELAESEAHTLAGSVGAIGLATGARLARALEQAFAARHTLDRSQAARLADQVLALRRDLERPMAVEAIAVARAEHRRLMLVTATPERAEQYVTEGFARGLDVVVTPFERARSAIDEVDPDALVVEIAEPSLDDGRRLLASLDRRSARPTLVVSSSDGMPLRLAIAHSGALGPLMANHAPADVLQRALSLIDARHLPNPSVLIVDSDPWALHLAALTLQQSGVDVHTLADPERYWETLETLAPDLILCGLGMPGVSGLDLCRATRADPRWREVPLMGMASAEEATDAREAYRAGMDDVVRKPLDRRDLAVRVGNRLRRSRLLRRHAEADPLTGLATRKKAERELDRFIRLARRHHHPVSVITFRLDGVEDVTQRHGQAVLDAVTLWFSHLLQQSFRAEDVVSRWEANDFVVGLFDARVENAVSRAREVMAALRGRQFRAANGAPLSLTCSAGIAAFPDDGGAPDELHAAADAALIAAGSGSAHEVLGVASDPKSRDAGRVDVLLVDNDAAVAALLVHALESRQYTVRWLRDGHEASAALFGDKPSLRARLLLLEVNLPALDGLSVLRGLASQEKLRHTRVIMLSARTTEAETVQAFELGASDYVAKPFSVAVLMERVRRALQ